MLVRDQKNRADSESIKNLIPNLEHLNDQEMVSFEVKSTFFIEMEETKSILTYGTSKSLAIIDELGRGTSTFDGMAIAYSVLVDLIERIQCRCIFATHYHTLACQF